MGLKGGLEEHLGLLIRGDESARVAAAAAAAVPPDPRGLPSLPTSLEARLPQLDQGLRLTHAEWLPVTNTRWVACIAGLKIVAPLYISVARGKI